MRMLLNLISLLLIMITGSYWMIFHILERGKLDLETFIEVLPIVIIFSVIGTFCIEMGRD